MAFYNEKVGLYPYKQYSADGQLESNNFSEIELKDTIRINDLDTLKKTIKKFENTLLIF